MNDKNICSCVICFENINTKCIDISIELECKHWFHSKCIKPWCKRCLYDNSVPTCPFCRQTISNEYLDILGIDLHSTKNDIFSITNSIELLTHIIKNKIFEDINKLTEYVDRYPNEIDNIIIMLENFIILNSIY